MRKLHPVRLAAAIAMICGLAAPAAFARVELQPCKNDISPEKQILLGKQAAAQVYKQMPVLPDSDPVSQYVRDIGEKLVAQAPGYHWPYNFHVVNSADVNAFALPGGMIFVNLGTVQAADTEAQLAAVLAHEISHVVLQHSVCNLEKEERVGVWAGLGQIASGLFLGGRVGALAAEGIGLTAGLSFLHMSRGAEKQADLEGVGILYDAGYDPRAMAQFFETIEAKYGNGGAQLLSDHPNPGNRTEYVDKEIASFPPKPHYVSNTDQFRRIHKIAMGMKPYTAKQIASGEWRRSDPNLAVHGVTPYDASAPPMTRADGRIPERWIPFKGDGFSMEIPANWQVAGDRQAAMVAPPGGIVSGSNSSQNLVYGVMTDVYQPQQQGSNAQDMFNGLLLDISKQNPGLETSTVEPVSAGNATGEMTHAINRQANGGRGEHDWIVGIAQKDSMRYFVFVAPETDFNAIRSTFDRVLRSIRVD